MLRTVERILLACETVLVWIAILALIVLMFLTTADATFRYLFNSPITGAYEITEKYLITMGIFLAFSYAYRGDVFIRVSFLVDRFPPAAKLIVDYAAQILTLGYCAFFAVATLNEAINSMWEGSTLSAVPIPLAPSYFLVPARLHRDGDHGAGRHAESRQGPVAADAAGQRDGCVTDRHLADRFPLGPLRRRVR